MLSKTQGVSMDLDFDAYLKQYIESGFKLIKDTQENDTRSANLRIYTQEEYGEVLLKQKSSDTKVSIMQTMNGKVVFTQ